MVVAGWGLALALAVPAAAQDGGDGLAKESSCGLLHAGTAGVPDHVPFAGGSELPGTWPAAPAGPLPARVHLRTRTETFNSRYEFATRGGKIYGRARASSGPWRRLPLPACFAGDVVSISLDDDELIALDSRRRIYTMDNALKPAALFNWTSRWGPTFWTGPGYALPRGVIAWSWSVVSPLEDETWTDPAGNRTAIGSGKVSHIWGLRAGGRRITFWDPWLPLDESYEMCGPRRGRFKALSLSASGSYVLVIGAHGDLFTREYDFDISGHNRVFFRYSYENQRGRDGGGPIQLPAAPWVRQPKIRGRITSRVSIHKVGVDSIHRILRVEGTRDGRTGYWQRDVAASRAAGWSFHPSGAPLVGRRLENPARDSSGLDLGPGEDVLYRMRTKDTTGELLDYNTYCSPAHLRIREDGRTRNLLLHHVDGLRQTPRARGLDDVPREQYGALEGPRGKFESVTVRATRATVRIVERGWTFTRVGPSPGSAGVRLAGLRLSRARFRAARRGRAVAPRGRRLGRRVGTRVRYRLSRRARVTIRVQRARRAKGRLVGGRCVRRTARNATRRRCTRYRTLRGAIADRGEKGVNRLRLSGRWRGRRLARGRHRLIARAQAGRGPRSQQARARFRIVRR